MSRDNGVSAKPLTGTITNDSAAAGQIGEIIESTVLVASNVSLTTGVAADVTTITLTAGDWDVWGCVNYNLNASTTMSAVAASINTTSATLATPPNGGAGAGLSLTFTTGAAQSLPVGMRRLSLATSTTVYLVARATFAVNTCAAYGYIGARRVR